VSQRIVIVTGAKGGVGATTIATKLIQRVPSAGERMIVDADFSGKRSLAVWYDLSDDLDLSRAIGTATVAQSKAGPLVMELARTYEDGLTQTKAGVLRAVAGLSDQALIVVDAPQPFAASIRPFISRAAKIVVVTESSLLGIGVAHAVLAAMERFGIPSSRIAVVQTEVRGKSDLSRAEIEAALKMPLSAELPNERDRRFESRLDGLVSMLAAAPIADSAMIAEKPMFDLRSEA